MIEDNILQHSDDQNIHKLQKYLPENFCEQAADLILAHLGNILITTGFWVAGACETDGPVGAIVLADILNALGSHPVFVTDVFCADVLRQCREYRVIDFPIVSHEKSKQIANAILAREQPSLLISIERCGLSEDLTYYNMKHVDVSDYTAKLDYLFTTFPISIGIGDRGNEIGMGNLAREIRTEGLSSSPCVTEVQHLIIATVSNWAAYGIAAYLSKKKNTDLMRFVTVRPILEQLVAQGVVDGVTKQSALTVDGYALETIEAVVAKLCEEV